MKTTILLSVLFTSICFGAFEDWTSKDGRTVQIDLIKTSGEGDSLAGEFRMKNGKTVIIKAVDLDDAGAAKLKEAATKLSEAAKPEATASVFDEVLEGNLVKLDEKKLAKCTDATKPKKYYIFYYTASWCGPCQAYTPTLVKFYNDVKPNNENFELVLITADRDEKSMEKYAADKKMPWPLLQLGDVGKFEKKFNHGVKGIPSVITCDLEGKIVSRSEDPNELKKLVK